MGEEQGLSAEKPAWQVINDLFKRYGLAPPPVRLRDELVMHYIAARSEGLQPPVGEVEEEVFSSLGASKAPSCVSAGVAETPSEDAL